MEKETKADIAQKIFHEGSLEGGVWWDAFVKQVRFKFRVKE